MDQKTAFDILRSGQNVYLTGSAGTGKTYLINQYIDYLHAREVSVAVTASTGIAATHIGGQTIHSWSGIGIKESIGPKDLEKISKNKQRRERLENTDVLIIDEISMLSGKILTGVSEILKHFKKSHLPFGGLQVILSGDFFQLPPVMRGVVSNRERFAFMAPIWVEADLKVCYLTKQFRQEDNRLKDILNEMRAQSISEESKKLFSDKLKENKINDESLKLYTHNADVDSMNEQKLKANTNKPYTFEAKTQGKAPLIETLRQTVLAAPSLTLKKGAKVMFVRNNNEKGYSNGTTGVVVGFEGEDEFPKVQISSGRMIIAAPESWSIEDEKENILASYEQIPLRLAWAITVHKSQGMTLDEAEIDLSKTFETGQGYVALSRLKSWDGLQLIGLNQRALEVDNLAFKADRRFMELSYDFEKQMQKIPEQDLEIAFKNFVVKCGGTNDPEIIKANQQRVKSILPSGKKESTYVKTRKLIEDGKTLELIAFERDLSLGTIINHLEQIKLQFPECEISHLSPDHKTVEKVAKICIKILESEDETLVDKEGKPRLSAIHQGLNGQLDYDTIKLARIFI